MIEVAEVVPPIVTVLVVDVTVSVLAAVMAALVSRVVFARSVIVEAELMAADMFSEVPVDVTETLPADEVIEAVALVMAAEPEIVMFPVAEIAPVGATDVPPEIESVPPLAVRVPAPL